MSIKPMEEKKSEEWGLKTAAKIRDKIFEGKDDQTAAGSLLDPEKLVVCSYALGRLLSSYEVNLKASQLRRFYESLMNIKAPVNIIRTKPDAPELFRKQPLAEILMLKPQLAAAKAKQTKEVGPFFDVINPLLDRVNSIDDYEKLCRFVEAIVAYHKYCGGRD
jgi:CRISPR-associated protein Csm2